MNRGLLGQSGWLLRTRQADRGEVTSVPSAAADTLLLKGRSNRAGATITNTDANALYVLLADGVASATNYTVKLVTDAYFETPFGYSGPIRGIWAADGVGAALVTEFT